MFFMFSITIGNVFCPNDIKLSNVNRKYKKPNEFLEKIIVYLHDYIRLYGTLVVSTIPPLTALYTFWPELKSS